MVGFHVSFPGCSYIGIILLANKRIPLYQPGFNKKCHWWVLDPPTFGELSAGRFVYLRVCLLSGKDKQA